MTLRVFEAFSGIGTQRMALRNLGIEHEVVAIAEIDKYAIASYEAIHGDVNNLGDISKIKTEDIPDHDLFTYSFPCQDISVAGKQAGLKEGSGTRSGLLWECEKVIEVKRPKYLLMENVKNLVGKKFKADFDKWLERLEELGYSNYWQVLNAKDYGIPQNRERVFCVSILGEHTPYEFPEGFELKLRLKDILEDEVEEKFYLSKEQVEKIKFSNFNQEKKRLQEKEYSDTLLARDYKDPKVVRVGGIFDKENQTHQAGSIYDKEQLAPTIDTMQGGWRQPSVLIKNGTKKGYLEATEGDGIDLAYVNSENRRDRVQPQMIQTLDTTDNKGVVVKPYSDKSMEKIKANIRDVEGLSTTITANPQRATIDNGNLILESKEEFGRMGKQAIETFNENNLEHGDTINPFNKKPSSENGVSPTLTTRPEGFKTAISVVENFRIRKLTPKECWRLMGCTDEDFEKAQKVNSNSQLYKQAGNAIVVDVLENIFNCLFKGN